MIYIDFYSGTYGHFLSFLIYRYILKVEEYRNYTPFTEYGTSHNHPELKEKLINRKHFSEWAHGELIGPYEYWFPNDDFIKENANNFLIQIKINELSSFTLASLNRLLRGGDDTIDFSGDFEKNLLKKFNGKEQGSKWSMIKDTIISEFGTHTNYPRQKIRNLFYHLVCKSMTKMFNKFQKFNLPTFEFYFEDFHNIISLKKQLNELSHFLKLNSSHDIEFDNLDYIHNIFLKNNISLNYFLKANEIFNFILNDKFHDIDTNILEEALLNGLIIESFNISYDISVFEDSYPKNTKIIIDDIKKVLKKRNSNFNTDLPIAVQYDKIIKDFNL